MTDNRAGTAPPTDSGTNLPGERSDAAGGTDQPPENADEAAPTGVQTSQPEAPTAGDVPADDAPTRPRYAPPTREQFDWRGWVLVSIVVVSFLFVPGAILLLPHAQSFVEWLGLPLRAAYLGLPMIPAVLLGATAVWAAVRSRSSGE